ncbi:85/88 kDa calcium-independent phospholipase A2 isoform X4 [Diabrotica virgifera virgifera]|uniref:phospholipase A2 n=1 Tax=Diabrotica virgifera virgifera TaxID=50390 RepID=A0ABM5IF01_DIAVI|nr:85/88 kDa calcium-independent phospholipase A2 isoform X4 [Diabrotica virgifera virgifera]
MGLVPAKHVVLRSLLSAEPPPNKVVETRPDFFTSRSIHCREDGLVLYLPSTNEKGPKANYEIVLHRPTTETLHQIFRYYGVSEVFPLPNSDVLKGYSLFRTPSLELAENRFITYKDKIPQIVEVAKEMCNIHSLQKVCDVVLEHPTWTLAHLAAHFALYDCFNDSTVNSLLNSTEIETGMSPLQVAITTQNIKTIQIMIAANCSLEHLDYEGNSVFHYAASTTKEIINALSQTAPQRSLNARNKNGHTPLHMACLADKSDCVTALILAGADVNIAATKSENPDTLTNEPSYVANYLQKNPNTFYSKDMKNGGTPLHWASSRQVVEALIDVNCHINSLNFEFKTALHVMVERNRLDCVVALLSRQANADLGDKDGNRPLHLAVKANNVAIIQALIIFGVDLNILNNKGETARHMITAENEPQLLYYLAAVGARRCEKGMEGCTEGCAPSGTYEGIPPPKVIGQTNRDILNAMLSVAGMEVASEKHKNGHIPRSGRLLCLDGGGIRGLILIQMLLELEHVFKKPIKDSFDWLAGTSTGGILCLAIATGKSMKECLCLYFRLKEQAFVGIRPYSSENLENILKDTFGTETVMSDIKHPRVMVTGVLADRKPVELHLFRSYTSPNDILEVKHDHPYELPHPPDQQHIWEVGRATGAAPTYFRAFGRFLDGGLIANNPTLDAMAEIHEHTMALKAKNRENEASPVNVVVSLGTGSIPVTEVKSIDVFKPESIWDSAKLVIGISFLGTLLVDQATSSDGRVVDRARAWCSSIGVPYFRFCPQMSEDVAMDEKADDKLVRMLWETKAYMYEQMSSIKELADIINRC